MPRFGKDKNTRNEELDRQAAEEVERLTRRGGPPGMGGGMGGGAPQIMSSPLDMIAAEMADKPRPSMRRQQSARRPSANPQQQAFTPMPSGEVGSSFGPGGLNPGPRMAGAAPPPPTFGGGDYDDDYGGHVTGPPVFSAEPDEDEEMSITELALMDHAAHTGHRPEDLVMQYDAGTAEEMRDMAMRQFYERQQARRPGPSTNSPFAPAGMRRGPSGGGGPVRNDDPAAAGGALAQRLANRRRREEEQARQAQAVAEPAPAPTAPRTKAATAAASPPAAKAEAAVDEGALARVLARRRAALGVDAQPAAAPEPAAEPDAGPEPAVVPGRRHAGSRAASSPELRVVPVPPDDDEGGDGTAGATPTRRSAPAAKKGATARKAAAKAPATKEVTKASAAKAKATPATKAARAPKAVPTAPKAVPTAPKAVPTAEAPPAARTTKKAGAKKAGAKKAGAKKAGATLAKAPAVKSSGRTTGKAKTVFCIECGEKNPAMAKFCFNCGNRLAVPEG